MQDQEFVALYRRRDEFNAAYKDEAIRLLRRDNQLEAVLLEGKILTKIKEELENSTYNLVRTQLAREVYTKLIGDLDVAPQSPLMTWEQNILNMQTVKAVEGSEAPKQLEAIDAEFKEVSQPEEQPAESQPVQKSEQAPVQAEEKPVEEVAVGS